MIGTESERDATVRWRNGLRSSVRVFGTTIVVVVSLGVLLWMAPPARVISSIADMNPLWLLAAVALEVGACLSYVLVFRRWRVCGLGAVETAGIEPASAVA